MKEQQASLNPPLFMNVPENYQLIHHLLVDEDGDIWIYVKSEGQTGILHLSEEGAEKGFHGIEADFDPMDVRMAAALGRLYFMLGGKNETRIYVAERPD